jgi:hypothetical protein
MHTKTIIGPQKLFSSTEVQTGGLSDQSASAQHDVAQDTAHHVLVVAAMAADLGQLLYYRVIILCTCS